MNIVCLALQKLNLPEEIKYDSHMWTALNDVVTALYEVVKSYIKW